MGRDSCRKQHLEGKVAPLAVEMIAEFKYGLNRAPQDNEVGPARG
jgi:hypothetical protein